MSIPGARVPSWHCCVLDAVKDGAGAFVEFQELGSGSFACPLPGPGLQDGAVSPCWRL